MFNREVARQKIDYMHYNPVKAGLFSMPEDYKYLVWWSVTTPTQRQEEVKMTNEAKIKICQIIGYKDKTCPRIDSAGILYSWNWDNLKKLFA